MQILQSAVALCQQVSNVWESPQNRSSARTLTLPPVRNRLKFRLIGALRSCQSFIFQFVCSGLPEINFFCSKALDLFADVQYTFPQLAVHNYPGAL